MNSPHGRNVVFLAWDDWGGFYITSTRRGSDNNGLSASASGMVMARYAKKVSHKQDSSFYAYVKFVEDFS